MIKAVPFRTTIRKLLNDTPSNLGLNKKKATSLLNLNIELCTAVMNWIFSISHEQSKLSLKLSSTMYEKVNKQVKTTTSQYIGTCKSAYTKGYTLN